MRINRRELLKVLAASALLAVATTTRLGETALRVEPSAIVVRETGYDEEQDYTWARYARTAPDGTEFHHLYRATGGDFRGNQRWLDSRDKMMQVMYERSLSYG